jgi:hypothetical protein
MALAIFVVERTCISHPDEIILRCPRTTWAFDGLDVRECTPSESTKRHRASGCPPIVLTFQVSKLASASVDLAII